MKVRIEVDYPRMYLLGFREDWMADEDWKEEDLVEVPDDVLKRYNAAWDAMSAVMVELRVINQADYEARMKT